MKPIDIDFAPRSLARSVQQTPILTWLLLLAAVACWLAFAVKAVNLVKQKETVAALLAQATSQVQAQLAERAAHQLAATQFTIPASHAKFVNHAVAQLNLPWRDLFDALEAATPADIALLAIEPNAKKHVLKGTAEAKTSDDMIAYVARLKKQALFESVLLTRHEINEQDPNRPIRFQFEAQWIEVLP